MTQYADSSFLVSCYVIDANTPRANGILSLIHRSLVFTDLHALEVQNAFQLGVFRGHLSRAEATAARNNLQKDLRSGRLLRTVVKWPAVFRTATRLSQLHSRTTGTRSLDVLHVASARSLRATEFLSFDARQLALAVKIGLNVRS